jgi:hypothetical protein
MYSTWWLNDHFQFVWLLFFDHLKYAPTYDRNSLVSAVCWTAGSASYISCTCVLIVLIDYIERLTHTI